MNVVNYLRPPAVAAAAPQPQKKGASEWGRGNTDTVGDSEAREQSLRSLRSLRYIRGYCSTASISSAFVLRSGSSSLRKSLQAPKGGFLQFGIYLTASLTRHLQPSLVKRHSTVFGTRIGGSKFGRLSPLQPHSSGRTVTISPFLK